MYSGKIAIVILLIINLTGFSQSKRFNHLTTDDGISQSEVYSFLQDKRGFMWIGTIDGLNRYDGYSIEVFNTKKNNPHALSNNTVRTMVEDELGRIWIGTNAGLNVFDPVTELFYQIPIDTIETKNPLIWSLLIYNNHLIVGTNKGLWVTNINGNDLKKIESGFRQINNSLNLIIVRSIIKSKKGGFWALSVNKMSRIELRADSGEDVLLEEYSLDGMQYPIAAVEDLAGNIWIAFSRSGLIRYNPESKQYKSFNRYGTQFGPASSKCSSLALDQNGNLWIGTTDKGLNLVQSGELHKDEINFELIQHKPYDSRSLNSNLIFSLYISAENQLWVGTIGSGVNIYNPNQKKFSHYKFRELSSDDPNPNFIRSIYVDSQDRIWTGTHNMGLFLFDRENKTSQKIGFETQSIYYISRYKDNKVFLCTSRGIYLVQLIGNNFKILSYPQELSNYAVFYIVNSKTDIFWIATLHGLVRAKIADDKIIYDKTYSVETNPGISNSNCRVILHDDVENELLVGTEGGGLNIISLNNDLYPEKIKFYQNTEDSNSVSNNYVRSIIKDKNQNIWIGTYEGLNKVIRDKHTGNLSFRVFTTEDGLPNNMIQLIAEDNYNSLWIGTNGGLSQFIPEQNKFINYSVNDGIQSNEFSEHCVFKKPDGEIIMGGINGINTFHPSEIEISRQTPQVNITDFNLFNKKVFPLENIGGRAPLLKSIVLTDSIFLLPKQNNIAFGFSAMIYPSAEKVKYAYRLEGFDDEWHYTDSKLRNANYTNLRHGNYTFMVKATNNDGIWHDVPRKVFIQIRTPFFLTWFAFVIYGLFIILVYVYFSYFTVIKYTTKKSLLLEQEHNQKIHELDEMRTRFFINISHDLRTPLTLIRGPLNSMLQDQNRNNDDKDKLQLIRRNVTRLNYLIEQLLDVRKAESGKLEAKLNEQDIIAFTKDEITHFSYALDQKGLSLKVVSDSEIILASFDPGMISKVYFNIISNAIKFTEKGNIEIRIEKVYKGKHEILKNSSSNSFIKVEIRDTGRGIPADQKEKIFDRFYQGKTQSGNGYGIGLSHSRELIDAHHGYIEAESKENTGTTIRFFIPESVIPAESNKILTSSTEDIYLDDEKVSTETENKPDKMAKTILIIEDNADMRMFIRTELKKEYNIIEAGDGLEGFKKATEKIPDLIVCDVMMPNMDGIEFCDKIKSNLDTSHIPLILLTAKVDLKTKYDGINTGADDYIPKPFDMEYLKIRIKNLLESREKLRKLFQKSMVLEPSAVTVTSVDEKFLANLIQEIEAGIPDSDFSVSSLESKMGMSHANFYRKVKNLTGQSGQELLLSMRLKRAHQIMSENSGIRVAEISYMVGFQNPNYFSKCFKKRFGVTPTEFNK